MVEGAIRNEEVGTFSTSLKASNKVGPAAGLAPHVLASSHIVERRQVASILATHTCR